MGRIRNNKHLILSVFLLAIGGVFLLMGLFPLQGNCYTKCSPIIGVTNYQYFAALLKNMIKNRFIAQLKLCFLEKINVEFAPGSFAKSVMGMAGSVTDFASITSAGIDKELSLQMDYLRAKITPGAFQKYLKATVIKRVQEDLLKKGINTRQIRGIMNDYENNFLDSKQTSEIYFAKVLGFNAMASEFMNGYARFASGMTGIAGNIDVADWVQGKQVSGGNANTLEIMKECEVYAVNGLKNIGTVAGIDIGNAIEGVFSDANGRYLKEKLEIIHNADGTTSFTLQEIEKIVEDANKAAIGAVRDYIAQTMSGLGELCVKSNAALSRTMKKAIDKADSIISQEMSLEKEEELAVNHLYVNIEKKVKDLIGDLKKVDVVAREEKSISILDNVDIQKIAALLAGRDSSVLQRKVAVKYYIVALESRDVATAIRMNLSKLDPGVIERGYDDMAWKDLARFNYYLLILHNQKIKLMALRVMAESLNALDAETVRHIESGGLPKGF